ncbi:uncharacterized protein C11orf86 homolog isoform X2 [Macrotis lagotis]|uniref:uncharacterized protein C11orf86 homolog isoform X2 n=1 Tax=Macrotis lagotis TaxID=92651 RepID=UPI003D68029E
MVTTRSQSLRVRRASYGKLQELYGESSEYKGQSPLVPKAHQQVPHFRRSLSFRHRREKPRCRDLESSFDPPEDLNPPPPPPPPPSPHEVPLGSQEDTEQLIQSKNQGKQRIRQYKKMDYALRRTWGNFVANLPGVTLSRSTSPSPPEDAAS